MDQGSRCVCIRPVWVWSTFRKVPKITEKPGRDHYASALKEVGGLDAPDWLKDLRRAGADRFDTTEFPNYKQEAWRFTNVTPIVQTPFTSRVAEPISKIDPEGVGEHLYDEPDWNQLVFVDGFYSADLSRLNAEAGSLRVGSLSEAIRSDDPCVRKHLDQGVQHSSAFITLNSAFIQDGAFFYLPANTVLETPVHFLFITTASGPVATYPRNLFVAGSCSQATILESYVGLSHGADYLTNAVTEIVLEDGARLERHKLVEEGQGSYHLSTANVRQGRDTFFKSYAVTLSGKIVRNELDVHFEGEGSEADLNGLYLNEGTRLTDNALHVTHDKPNCRSRMAYKGILNDESRAVFTGKVLVTKDSQRTDSDQLNSNLLLSDKATIDTKPQLEIFADDVKCTHGATVGSFPDELVFYFQSRGMSAEMARGILTYGFAGEIVDTIEVGPLHEKLDKYIFAKYSPK